MTPEIKIQATDPGSPEALRLYDRAGYRRRNAFGDYCDDEYLSVFMEKILL
jgi:putative acetyltransferase